MLRALHIALLYNYTDNCRVVITVDNLLYTLVWSSTLHFV